MSARTKPPFRADHVGSLLRPQRLLQAREDHKAGKIGDDELREIENDAIREVVKMQQDAGLKDATDGEFRRHSWHMDFIYSLGGVSQVEGESIHVHFKDEKGEYDYAPPAMCVDGKVELKETIFGDAFEFLRDTADGSVPKLTIPSPSMVHYRGGNSAIDRDVYPNMEDFWSDLTKAYSDEMHRLYDMGCRYLQLARSGIVPTISRSPRTCAAATISRCGWLRAATTSWPRRSSTTCRWTASSSSTTTSAPARSSRCASCRRGRWSCSG
jgi:5-methyltetrahydropteroyltriglutamate--homocysteine methyltransferase